MDEGVFCCEVWVAGCLLGFVLDVWEGKSVVWDALPFSLFVQGP